MYSTLPSQENCVLYRTCFCKWKEVQQPLNGCGVDGDLHNHVLSEAEKWEVTEEIT